MIIETLALAAAITATDPFNHPGYSLPSGASGARPIDGPPPYPYARVDSTRRPGFGGRLWLTLPYMGGVDVYPTGEQDLAEAHGVIERGQVVHARVGELSVPISPWQRWDDRSYIRLEASRQQWLAENGFTGGVRTFVNDANFDWTGSGEAKYEIAQAAPARIDPATIQPRAIIELSPEVTKFRSRMHVNAGDATKALARAGVQAHTVTKVIVPDQQVAQIK
ncbi:MAG: hypothetical protein WC718_16795 [Phycisphaerales bacterium]|jgi:hypothetical protein